MQKISAKKRKPRQNPPLAADLRPKKIEDFFGQKDLLAKGRVLRNLIEQDEIKSAVFFGPSGVGKTAVAKYIADKTNSKVVELNAVLIGVSDLKKIITETKQDFMGQGEAQRTLVILDEIHHFNRTQQDILLPSVESGEIILIGITTENPHYYINRALLSRFSVFEFKNLEPDDLKQIIKRAEKIKDIQVSEDARNFFINQSNGDARRLLNALEISMISARANKVKKIDLDLAKESFQKKNLQYDKSDDEHYDTISAFIKSMRGSDPDAALYWMAKMLESGEDPRYVARRIFIFAAEDVGNAEPAALMVASAAFHASEVLGYPEIRIPLAQAVTYVASSPKSNASYLAIDAALREVKTGKSRRVPAHLRSGVKNEGYEYPHSYPDTIIDQEYMPDPMQFYFPNERGKEARLKKYLEDIKAKKKNATNRK